MKRLMFLFVLIFSVLSVNAETGVIKGTIVDKENGKALVGANLVIDGTGYTATSNKEGNFIITGIPEGQLVSQGGAYF